jgi:hypothetical protein
MKKKALALSVLAAVSSQAGAFQFDTGDDWNIRWDNTIKGNLITRVGAVKGQVVNPSRAGAAAAISDDSDYSVNRKNGGIASSRVDLRSELDVVWRQDFGFRISGSGWYDAAYDDADNPTSGTLPRSGGVPYDGTWAGLNYKPGDYSNEAKDLHYAGGELLDAFVFGNWQIGETALGVRLGQHTIYWGQSLLGNGAVTGIAFSMAAIDSGKALSVPGTEAQELFIPSGKLSSTWQLTDNLALSGYYEYDHRINRNPETGTFFSPRDVLTDNSECFPLAAGTADTRRTCFKVRDDKIKDSGEFGFNLQYTIEPWNLETSWVYIKGSDRMVAGVYGTLGGITPEQAARFAKPWDEGGANATVFGEWGWVYKKDIETFGISLAKEMFDISFGMDIVYRKDGALNPDFTSSLTRAFAGGTPADYSPDPDDYPGATGNFYGVVVNGLGFLNGDWGLWDGGSWIVEYTTSWLDKFKKNEQFADPDIHKGRVTTQIGVRFRPTWYQVFPGWDMTLPVAVNYAIDGENPPQGIILEEEVGNGSVGIEFNIDQVWIATAQYNMFFGPANPGTSGPLKDRDNVSLTVSRTF